MLVTLFFYLSNIFIFDSYCKAEGGNILYVGGLKTGNYTSIQNAIDDASDGDTIFIFSGSYSENIVINKSINLVGENKNKVIFGYFSGIYLIYIKSSGVNLTRFTIQNNQIGILINDFKHSFINISENIFSNNMEGIRIYNSSDITIKNNSIYNNVNFGIVIFESKNIKITSNNISHNFKGIYLGRWSNYNNISKNNCSQNGNGVYLDFSFNNSIINNDFIKNTWGVYLKNSRNNNITINNIEENDIAGITLENSDDNIFEPNYFNENGADIKKKPKPPNIKAPGFEFLSLIFTIFIILSLRKYFL